MGKSVGIIGNFSGKLGNAVGFKNSASNDGRTQGVRIYQPVVKNPKSYAQALQRARMLPINNMYRLLKDIIDRGQEGISYGNKSRLAWLKKVMKDFNGPWQDKGTTGVWPIACPISKGSLRPFSGVTVAGNVITLGTDATIATAPTKVNELYAALLKLYPTLQEGDQVTIISGNATNGETEVNEVSFVMSSTDETAVSGFAVAAGALSFADAAMGGAVNFGAVIISREGSNGAHLRSTQSIIFATALAESDIYTSAAVKGAAIRSYMTEGSNVDWPQEEISPNFQ